MNIIFCYYAVNTFSCPRADLKHTLPHLPPLPTTPPPPPASLPQPPPAKRKRGISHLRSSHLVHCKVSILAGNETLSCMLDVCVCIKNNSNASSALLWEPKKKKKKCKNAGLKNSPTIHFTQGADTTGGPCAMVSPPPPPCSRRSTRPLINRLELLTGGSSVPRRPCHFHYLHFHRASFGRRGTAEEEAAW